MWSFNCQLSSRRERERKKEGRVRELVSLLHIYAPVPNLRFLGRQAVCGRRTALAWPAQRSCSRLQGRRLLAAPCLCSGGGWPGQTSPLLVSQHPAAQGRVEPVFPMAHPPQ